MSALEDGTFTIRLQELGRLELWLGGPADAGYLLANGVLEGLPVGSSLTGSVFAWMPPAGYIGSYRLVFVRGHERISVVVTVVERGREITDEVRMKPSAFGYALRHAGLWPIFARAPLQ